MADIKDSDSELLFIASLDSDDSGTALQPVKATASPVANQYSLLTCRQQLRSGSNGHLSDKRHGDVILGR